MTNSALAGGFFVQIYNQQIINVSPNSRDSARKWKLSQKKKNFVLKNGRKPVEIII